MAISKIQSGDKVKVIAGNFKGIIGTISKVITKNKGNISNKYVTVSGVPKIVKYRRKVTYNGETFPGEKFEVDRFINISNVSLLTADNKLTKVQIKIDSQGKKSRISKKSGELITKQVTKQEITTK